MNAVQPLSIKAHSDIAGNRKGEMFETRCSFATLIDAKKQRNLKRKAIVVNAAIDAC
jgi:hypothetical protein